MIALKTPFSIFVLNFKICFEFQANYSLLQVIRQLYHHLEILFGISFC